MDMQRAEARRALNMIGGYGQVGGAALARAAAERAPTELEIAQAQAEQHKYVVAMNRRQALEIALGLSRFDDASHAIREARVIAEFLNLEID